MMGFLIIGIDRFWNFCRRTMGACFYRGGLSIEKPVPDSVLWGATLFSLICAMVLLSNGFDVMAEPKYWRGNVKYLAKGLRGAVALVRMVSAMVAVIMGAWVAIKWKHAGQQAQGELINYLVMLFFLFGATLFIDAVIAITVGSFSFINTGGVMTTTPNESLHMRFDTIFKPHPGPSF